jgi:phenylalanyl-tRNA synthetase beta chain
MKVSVNTLRYLNEHYHSAGDPAPNGVDELVEKIGAQLGAVEEVTPFGDRFKDVVVVRLVSCVDHPNSDHLRICRVDDGGVVTGVERDEQGLVQIVTGAPNVREGFIAAWLPPGSTVPESFGKEPFVLEARALRGETSFGMLASARELTLGDDHDGILELDQDITPGTPFADLCHIGGDVIIDMENKMFTHRPDCFGWLGIAREIAGIYHQAYKSPQWYSLHPAILAVEGEPLELEVRNELPELVPRFTAITMRDITIAPSPLWVRADLARAGLKSINNIVDYTNIYMMETGQPIHAYDYDKVKALSDANHAVLTIRHPKPDEEIALLNGKTIKPWSGSMMVATDKQLICLGGAMGGRDTEVDEHTKNIIIEAATWDMYTMRRTSMAHGIFTDAVTRFTKGQSPLQNPAVLAKIVDQISRFAGGKVASHLIDNNHLPPEAMERGNIYPAVTVSRGFIASRLGIDLSAEEMADLLRNVEFTVDIHDEHMTIQAPFWRTDIVIPEDVVEEVGRLYGYDKLPLTLPKRDLTPAVRSSIYDLKTRVAEHLQEAGANEVLTYSFVHGRLLQQAGQNSELSFQLGNALSPDLQYYRMSVTPSLLDKVHANNKAGYESFALFELNKAHLKSELDEDGLPLEFERLALVFAAGGKAAKRYAGAPFFEAKLYLDGLLQSFGLEQVVTYRSLTQASFVEHPALEEMAKPFEPAHAAVLLKDNCIVGVVGEYRATVRKALKLPVFCAGFELSILCLDNTATSSYIPLPRFPKVEQDICLRVPVAMPYQQLYDFVLAQVTANQPENVYTSLSPVDIYQREHDAQRRQVTLRLTIASYDRTLTDAEITKLLDIVATAAHTDFGAERV